MEVPKDKVKHLKITIAQARIRHFQIKSIKLNLKKKFPIILTQVR